MENITKPNLNFSYIMYCPKAKYIFNRSVNLSSEPFKKVSEAIEVLGLETYKKAIGDAISMQMSLDFESFEVLEILNFGNENLCNQAKLNEIKKKWCEIKGAICDTRDKSIEIEADKIIYRNIIHSIKEVFYKLAAALAPFIKKEWVEDFDSRMKYYASNMSAIKKYIRKFDLNKQLRDIESQISEARNELTELISRKYHEELEAKQKLDELNNRLTNLPDDIIKMQNKLASLKDEVGRWEALRDAAKQGYNTERKYLSSPGYIVGKLEISFENLSYMIAALKFIYKMSIEDIKEYFKSNLRVIDHYNFGDMDKIYNRLTDKNSAKNYISRGYEVFKKLVDSRKIEL